MISAAPQSSVVVVPNVGYVLLIAAAAALGGFLFGYDTAVINGAVLALKAKFNASSLVIGLAVSLALLGSAVGAFFAGPLADRIGRIKCMVIASILFTISSIGSGLPFTIYDFIFWRFLGGIGIGAASVIAPAYIAECSPADMRGRLGSLQQLAIVSRHFCRPARQLRDRHGGRIGGSPVLVRLRSLAMDVLVGGPPSHHLRRLRAHHSGVTPLSGRSRPARRSTSRAGADCRTARLDQG